MRTYASKGHGSGYQTGCGHKYPKSPLLPMVGVVTDHPVFCQQQAGRVLVAGRFQIGSSKAFYAMLDVENKVLSGRSVGDNTDREQKTMDKPHRNSRTQ